MALHWDYAGFRAHVGVGVTRMEPESDLRRKALLFAPMLADGRLSWESVRHLCALLAEGNPGPTTRLCWAVRDQATYLSREQHQLDQGTIRRARSALLATGQRADADRLAQLLDTP